MCHITIFSTGNISTLTKQSEEKNIETDLVTDIKIEKIKRRSLNDQVINIITSQKNFQTKTNKYIYFKSTHLLYKSKSRSSLRVLYGEHLSDNRTI